MHRQFRHFTLSYHAVSGTSLSNGYSDSRRVSTAATGDAAATKGFGAPAKSQTPAERCECSSGKAYKVGRATADAMVLTDF